MTMKKEWQAIPLPSPSPKLSSNHCQHHSSRGCSPGSIMSTPPIRSSMQDSSVPQTVKLFSSFAPLPTKLVLKIQSGQFIEMKYTPMCYVHNYLHLTTHVCTRIMGLHICIHHSPIKNWTLNEYLILKISYSSLKSSYVNRWSKGTTHRLDIFAHTICNFIIS